MNAEDLMFLIRHDKPKVNRVRAFLSWKDVRKNVKGKEDATEVIDDADELDDTAGIFFQFVYNILIIYR